MEVPLISIVTPTLNQGHFIEETIRSVLNQGYPSFEHIVIDGGSTDSTIEILKKYPHLIWESEKDCGQAHAVNKGFQKSRGEIIGWINSDDTYLPGTFSVVAKKFQSDPKCCIVFGDYHAVDESGSILYSVSGFAGSYDDLVRWWDYTYAIHQPTVFVRKSVIEKVGLLNESFHFAMDYEWWLRLAQHHKFIHVPHYLATYRLHEGAKTFEPLEKNVYPEQLRASKKHWGNQWAIRYWKYQFSYAAFRLRKPHESFHSSALAETITKA